jgi:hypothetical protein
MRHSDYRSKIGEQPFPLPVPFASKIRQVFIRKDVLPYRFGVRNFTWTLRIILLIYFIIQTFWFLEIQYKDALSLVFKLLGK